MQKEKGKEDTVERYDDVRKKGGVSRATII